MKFQEVEFFHSYSCISRVHSLGVAIEVDLENFRYGRSGKTPKAINVVVVIGGRRELPVRSSLAPLLIISTS